MHDTGSQQIIYRTLQRLELRKLAEIDSSQVIGAMYRVREGRLELAETLPDWLSAGTIPVERTGQRETTGFNDISRRVVRLTELYDEGGVIFGAFDDATLVGMSVLENRLRGKNRDRMQLAGLWVGRAYRGQGIGRRLVELVKTAAEARGARYLYICSFSSENTVRFYLGIGCTLTAELDPELFAKEPVDIHFELAL